MVKRVRLDSDVVDLKLTNTELKFFRERADKAVPERYKYQDAIVTVNKEPLQRLVADYLRMKKLLRRKGFTVNHALHYHETKEFKRGLKESDIPQFLKKEKKPNDELEGKVKGKGQRRRRVRAG